MRALKMILVVLLSICLLLTGSALAAGPEISISYVGEPASVSGIPAFLDENSGSVMASAEVFSRVLGIDTDYDADSASLTLSQGGSVMTFVMEDTDVQVNNRTVIMDTVPVLVDGEPYVPLRFAAERLGYELIWYGEENRVDIRPVDRYELGITESRMLNLYGSPTEVRKSEKGYMWQVYGSDLSDYHMVGLDGDQVAAYYICSENWRLPFGIQSGMKLSACNTIMNSMGYRGSSGTGYMVYSGEADALTVYFGPDANHQIYAALYEDAKYLTLCSIDVSVLSAMESTLADLTNVMRVRGGLEPLMYEERVAAAAGTHADDMAQNDFFSHKGSDGTDKTERLQAAGYSDFYVSEALCKAFSDSFEVFASYYENTSYREILMANFSSVGVGFSYNPESEGILYGVQLFFAEKD